MLRSLKVINEIRSRKMKQAGRIACKGETTESCKLSVVYFQRKILVRWQLHKYAYNVKKDLQERICEEVEWVQLASDSSQCQPVLTKLWVL